MANGRTERNFPREDDAKRCNPMFVIALILKFIAVILSCVVLGLTAKYNGSYMIDIIIGICSLTLVYAAVSIMVEFFVMIICPVANDTCHVAEAVCSFIFLSAWLLICGISTQISLSAGSRTTELFGWVGACTGIGCGVFLATAALYCLQIVQPIRDGKL